jgi:stage II sporulation protein AA (anti-sigma F factor antagonist)
MRDLLCRGRGCAPQRTIIIAAQPEWTVPGPRKPRKGCGKCRARAREGILRAVRRIRDVSRAAVRRYNCTDCTNYAASAAHEGQRMNEPHPPRPQGVGQGTAWRIDAMSSAVLVTVASEIDLAAVPVFSKVLNDAAAYGLPVILNCAALRYLDSTGMDVLLRYRTRVPRVALASPQEVIRKIFGVLSLDTVIPIYESVDTAIAACGDADALAAPGALARAEPPASASG